MRNTTSFQIRSRSPRSQRELAHWQQRRESWVGGLDAGWLFHGMFDHLPGLHFFAKAVEIIRRDFAQAVSIAEIATTVGQSLRQLQRQFRTALGISPQEFLIVTRIVAAQRMLEEEGLSVSEISQQCGFVDASSFTQHFRKRVGKTPASYRRALAEREL
ncbi:MAG: helix-turn-helix domain-containing protein [Verrucomicrobiales bacterium]|nr:helix-turn-helix domain-containing protein [Verrucomicrobiales bacterium]